MKHTSSADEAAHRQPTPRRWWKPVAAVVLCFCFALALGAEYLLHNAEPILRRRIIETLSARFDAPVELDHLSISLFKGIEVEGSGLRLPAATDSGRPASPAYPLLAVQSFSFRTSLRGLLHQPTHVALVRVSGLELHIPPPAERARWLRAWQGAGPADPSDLQRRAKIAIEVDDLRCEDVHLLIESAGAAPNATSKPPLAFHIAHLNLERVGPHQPMRYDAELTNPKPAGTLHVTGHFGPWASAGSLPGLSRTPGAVPDPGQTPIDGVYDLPHADLGTIHGLGGTLSSTGHFAGVLDRLTVDGRTDTPDFRLQTGDAAASNHALPLHTDFHAVVDGTTGNTFLQPVHARLGSSAFLASGSITKLMGRGHNIDLQLDVPDGRMQDFLRLATKTDPPLLSSGLTMQAHLHLPPGPERVADRLAMAGTFNLTGVRFNNLKTQARIDALSLRAKGAADDLTTNNHPPATRSELSANFSLAHGVMDINGLRYSLPGALVLLNGVYSLDGRLFEFKGRVRTDATASAMVGGWRGLLLQPIDRYFAKNGAGVELPIEISGTAGDIHFGLAGSGGSDTPGGMLADVRIRQQGEREMRGAKSEAAQADAEDLLAARAPTLAEAERLHASAVHHRAIAQAQAQTAQTLHNRNP